MAQMGVVPDELPGQPEERFLEVVVGLSGDVIVLCPFANVNIHLHK